MNDPHAFNSLEEYAYKTIHTVNAYVLEVLWLAERHGYPLPERFNIDTSEWRAGADAVEQAVGRGDMDALMLRCDEWRERSKKYCMAWFEKLEKEILKAQEEGLIKNGAAIEAMGNLEIAARYPWRRI